MATYNGEEYLQEQLDSIARQTTSPYELVVCDDQSSDSTEAIVRNFAQRVDFSVSYSINSSRLNFADNFLRAASLCRGDYVTFCDQDDIWSPTKIDRITEIASSSNYTIISHKCETFGDVARSAGFPRNPTSTGRIDPNELSPWAFFPGFTCTVRKDLFDLYPAEDRPIDLLRPNFLLAHDRWVAFLASLSGPAFITSEPLVRYRQHAYNESASARTARSFSNKISSARTKFGYHFAKNYSVAKSCREVIEHMQKRKHLLDVSYLDEQLRRMREIENLYEARLIAFSSDSRVERARVLLQAASRRRYLNEPHGEPELKSLLTDLAGAIIASPGQVDSIKTLTAR